MYGEKLAAGLGWFSLGLGLYEAVTPGHLARVLGMEGHKGLLRLYGFREISVGLAILSEPQPSAVWLWARAGGDALDLATLGAAARGDNPKAPPRVGGHCRRRGHHGVGPSLRTAAQ